jgi:hypothetical protein
VCAAGVARYSETTAFSASAEADTEVFSADILRLLVAAHCSDRTACFVWSQIDLSGATLAAMPAAAQKQLGTGVVGWDAFYLTDPKDAAVVPAQFSLSGAAMTGATSAQVTVAASSVGARPPCRYAWRWRY